MDAIFLTVINLNKKQALDPVSFVFAVLVDAYFLREMAEPIFLVVSRMERTGYVVYPVLVTGLVGGGLRVYCNIYIFYSLSPT